LATRFYTKGTGSSRKVIPMKDGAGKRKPSVTGVLKIMNIRSSTYRDFADALNYSYKQIDADEDLLLMTINGIGKQDVKKYPGLDKVGVQMTRASMFLLAAKSNISILKSKTVRNDGWLIQAISTALDKTMNILYEAHYAPGGLEDIMKQYQIANPKDDTIYTAEGYSLPSIGADLTDINEDLERVRNALMHSFKNMRMEMYQSIKARRIKDAEAEKKGIPHFNDYEAYLKWQRYNHASGKDKPHYTGKYVLINGKRHHINHTSPQNTSQSQYL